MCVYVWVCVCAQWPTRKAVTVGVYLAVTLRGGSRDNRYLPVGWHLSSVQNVIHSYKMLWEISVQENIIFNNSLFFLCLISTANKIMMAFHKHLSWKYKLMRGEKWTMYLAVCLQTLQPKDGVFNFRVSTVIVNCQCLTWIECFFLSW